MMRDLFIEDSKPLLKGPSNPTCKQTSFMGSIPTVRCVTDAAQWESAIPVVYFGGNDVNMYEVAIQVGSWVRNQESVLNKEFALYTYSLPSYNPRDEPATSVTEIKVLTEAHELVKFAKQQHSGKDVIVMGHSLGTALAAGASRAEGVRCTALINPWTSFREMVVQDGSRLVGHYPAEWLSQAVDEFSTIDFVRAIPGETPVKVISGAKDQTIDPEMHRQVSNAANNGKLIRFEEAQSKHAASYWYVSKALEECMEQSGKSM